MSLMTLTPRIDLDVPRSEEITILDGRNWDLFLSAVRYDL